MAVKSYKMGPGTLTLGTGALEVAGQITNCRVEPSETVTAGERIPVLSGEELTTDDQVNYTFTLSGSLLQDLDTGGVVDWTWTNRGTWQPFTFAPNTALGREVIGECRPIPLTIGGDVAATGAPAADFAWATRNVFFGDTPGA